MEYLRNNTSLTTDHDSRRTYEGSDTEKIIKYSSNYKNQPCDGHTDTVHREYHRSFEQLPRAGLGCLLYQGYLYSPAIDRDSLISTGKK